MKSRHTCIYLIRHNSTGLHKIGVTSNIDRRFYQLGVNKVAKAIMYEEVYNADKLEKDLHNEYKRYRLPQSEWFDLSDYDVAATCDRIERNAKGYIKPVPKCTTPEFKEDVIISQPTVVSKPVVVVSRKRKRDLIPWLIVGGFFMATIPAQAQAILVIIPTLIGPGGTSALIVCAGCYILNRVFNVIGSIGEYF